MANFEGQRGVRQLGTAACAICALVAGQANAQSEAEGSSTDDNIIIVTATKRAANLQDIPLAISAVTDETLNQLNARAFNDYLRTVPGVAFVDRGPTENKIVIRGISDGPFAPTDPTTGIYINETPVTEANRGGDLNLFDIERVEVLRGPQGTLYGAGSMGGTVRVLLNKPDASAAGASFDGTLSATRHGEANYAVNAMVNLPLVKDVLAVRAVGYYRRDGGFIDDVTRNIEDVNSATVKGGRLTLRLTPTETFSARASILHQETDVNGRPQRDLALGSLQQSRLIPETLAAKFTLYNLELNQDFGGASLVSSTSYYDKVADNRVDYSAFISAAIGIPPVALGLQNRDTFREFSQEVRLASDGKGPFQWIVGGYYSRRRSTLHQFGDSTALPFPTGGLPLIDLGRDTTVKQFAAFGEATYDLTPDLHATAGVRWFDIRQSNKTEELASLFGSPNATAGKNVENGTNLKFALSYDVGPDNLIYAQAAEGFRIGGVNAPAPNVCGAVPDGFSSDSLWNYEVGSKNSFFDRKLTVNAAAFYIDWSNIQVFRALPCGFTFIDNAGDASSKGGELELTARPLAGLELSGSLAYTDTELRRAASGTGLVVGDPLPNVPKWTLYGSIQQSFKLGEMEAFVRADVQHVGSSLSDFRGVSSSAVKQPGYEIVGLRAGIQEDVWDAAIFVSNLFDKEAQTFTRDLALPGTLTTTVNRPRTIGLNVRARF